MLGSVYLIQRYLGTLDACFADRTRKVTIPRLRSRAPLLAISIIPILQFLSLVVHTHSSPHSRTIRQETQRKHADCDRLYGTIDVADQLRLLASVK